MKKAETSMDDDLRPEYDVGSLRVRKVGPKRETFRGQPIPVGPGRRGEGAMSETMRQYRSLEKDLIHVRRQHDGLESAEEGPILDAMEALWHELDPEEQQLLYSEGTKSLIRKRP